MSDSLQGRASLLLFYETGVTIANVTLFTINHGTGFTCIILTGRNLMFTVSNQHVNINKSATHLSLTIKVSFLFRGARMQSAKNRNLATVHTLSLYCNSCP